MVRKIALLALCVGLLVGCASPLDFVEPTATPAPPTDTPTPRPPPPTPTPDLRPRYIVQSGDSLWAIAARNGVTLEDLKAANRFYYGQVLEVGMELIIPIEPTPTETPTPTITPTSTPLPPGMTPTPPPPTATPTQTPTPDPRVFYEVQSGDSWWLIAAKHGITIEELVAANPFEQEKSLMPGDKLLIPVTPTATPTPSFRTATPTPTATIPPTPTPTKVPFATPVISPPPDVADWPRYLADLINERRFVHGLPPLRWSSALARAAQAHAQDCEQRDECSHIGSDGANLRTRLQRVGYEARWAGENWVFARYPEQALIWWYDEDAVDAPHRKNLLSPHYTEIGIGIARNRWGMFYFVADFAAPPSRASN